MTRGDGNWDAKYAAQKRYYLRNLENAKRYRMERRKQVIEAYGGKCVCCGETEWKFLTLDHPNGDGQQDRAKYRNATGQLFGWVIKNGFPKNYRLLCMNCNWVRRYDKCPHELDKTENVT